jgi:hypothetical protein
MLWNRKYHLSRLLVLLVTIEYIVIEAGVVDAIGPWYFLDIMCIFMKSAGLKLSRVECEPV